MTLISHFEATHAKFRFVREFVYILILIFVYTPVDSVDLVGVYFYTISRRLRLTGIPSFISFTNTFLFTTKNRKNQVFSQQTLISYNQILCTNSYFCLWCYTFTIAIFQYITLNSWDKCVDYRTKTPRADISRVKSCSVCATFVCNWHELARGWPPVGSMNPAGPKELITPRQSRVSLNSTRQVNGTIAAAPQVKWLCL